MQPVVENKEYVVERLSQAKLKDLETLHQAVYGAPPEKNYYSKKYNTAYTGVEWLGYVAYNKDRIAVAYYGVMPCFIEYGKEILLAAQSGDTMTHPAFRYKGMFVELSKITFELCRKAGLHFIFGFPNQNSYHGAVTKLGWQMTESMECFEIPVSAAPWKGISNRFPLFKKIYAAYSNSILRKYLTTEKGVPNSVIIDGFAGILRDEAYLNYKTYSDTIVIRVDKATAWIKIKNELVIGDMELNGQDFDYTMKKIKILASKLGLKKILFHSCHDTHLEWLFVARYPPIKSFPVLFQDLGANISFDKIKFTFADIDIF